MKNFNLFYISVALLAFAFLFAFANQEKEVVSFFGFAENKETEINYNHPVLVNRIAVSPGQAVKKGDLLLSIQRVKSKEQLSQEAFKIEELNSQKSIKLNKVSHQIEILDNKHRNDLAVLNQEKKNLEAKQNYESKVLQQLKTIAQEDLGKYNPIKTKMEELEQRILATNEAFELKRNALLSEKSDLQKPIQFEISRLNAQQAFDEENRVIDIDVVAPSDGLVGTILCKEQEHIPSYKTLVTFYEPHSDIIKGYVHEDFIVKVNVGTKLKVRSLKDANASYDGEVTGLGSRIVEIPTRLRKMADIKTYGREVLVKIPKTNSFLQKEKVALSYVD